MNDFYGNLAKRDSSFFPELSNEDVVTLVDVLNIGNVDPFLNLVYGEIEFPFTIFFLLNKDQINKVLKLKPVLEYRMNYPDFFLNEKYSITVGELGSGTYGTAKIGFNKKTLEKVAIKKINTKRLKSVDSIRKTFSEISILTILKNNGGCQNPYVLCLKDAYPEDRSIYVVTYLAQGGNLGEYLIYNQTGVDEKKILMMRLLEGLEFIHNSNIVQNDLKPGNIIMTERGEPIIIDFGLSCFVGPKIKNNTYLNNCEFNGISPATDIYESPEKAILIRENAFAIENVEIPDPKKSDIWSLGLVFYEIVNQHQHFNDDLYIYYDDENEYSETIDEVVDFKSCSNSTYDKPVNFGNYFLQERFDYVLSKYQLYDALINLMLIRNPDNRPSASDLLAMLISETVPEEWKNKIDCITRDPLPEGWIQVFTKDHEERIYYDTKNKNPKYRRPKK